MAARLRTANSGHEDIPSEEILETLLVEAGAAGVLPTDAGRLLNYLGLEQLSFDFMRELDFLKLPGSASGEIRAALHMAEHVVATQSGIGEKRERFSIFHEIAHCVLPEHNQKLFVDDDQTLSWWTKARLEREANRFAADLLFQGRLFTEQALSLSTSISTVVGLAPHYGASYEAALRRYTETHISPCALVVYEKLGKGDESFVEDEDYRIHYTVTSPSFRRRFFSSVQMGEESCKASEIYGPTQDWRIGQIVPKHIRVDAHDRNERWRFETEVFSNGYKIFQFLKRPTAEQAKR